MEIHQLRYFRAVARHRTFTRAAEVEHVAQPSLSQQIRKLEEELGTRLFERLPRSAQLTVFGQAFLPKAERILRELGEARIEMLEMAGNDRGAIALGVIPTIAPYLLPRILTGFLKRHTSVTARVIEDITPVLIDRLQQGTIHMAMVALPVPGNTHSSLALLEKCFYASLPVSHPRAGQETIKLSELKDDPFLILKDGHCFRDNLIAACREFRVKPNVVFESGQFSTILAMVSAGMGVPAVPAMAARPLHECRFIPITGKRSRRKIGILRLKRHFETRAEGFLIRYLLENCDAVPAHGAAK